MKQVSYFLAILYSLTNELLYIQPYVGSQKL